MEIKKDSLGNEYYVSNGFIVDKKDTDEAYQQSLREVKELCDEFGSNDPLDWDAPVTIPFFDRGLHSIRNADIIENKLYLDEDKQTIRYLYKNKEDGNIRNEAIILLNDNENRLSEVITQLPYGLIDKQATGIGATHLELHCSKRNSIIVVPTRALGENKCGSNSNFLYVGTQKRANSVTSNTEIKDYLIDPSIEYKKIVVVADSLKRVIDNLQELDIDVYREYFCMVDEVDTIQADNHFRPQLSNVIDYYFKFKLQRRALVSATVKEFSHPKLQGEPLTTIKKETPRRRNITLLHTNNINELLVEEIQRISSANSEDKILVAYNSLTDILSIITRLPLEIRNRCGILCSETNYRDDRIEQQYRAEIDSEDRLSYEIIFMTCAYFAGLDMKDTYHLITVSSVQYSYTVLPLNKLTQIYGRCRINEGVISDTIIYSTLDKPFYYNRDYRNELRLKADRIVDYLESSKRLQLEFTDLEDIFNRIEPLIIDEATDAVFKGKPIALTRKNVLSNEFEVSYFNIDTLYDQMYSYSMLYSNMNSLYNVLGRDHTIESFDNRQFAQETEASRGISNEEKIQRVQNCIDDLMATLATIEADTVFNSDSQFERYIEGKIRTSRSIEKEFYYSRVNELYKYIDINVLNRKLLEICTEKNNVKYKRFKNAVYFWALADNHSFKEQITRDFSIGEKYTSLEIKQKLDRRLRHFFLVRRNVHQSTLKTFLTSIINCSHTEGKSRVRGYDPRLLIELGVTRNPIHMRIPAEEDIDKYFKF